MLYFAHDGEVHESAAEAASHSVLDTWYIALPLFILSVFGIAAITYLVTRGSKSAVYMVVLATLFIAGVATYTTSAPISILALSVGFGMALFQVLIGLGKPHETKKQD